jgi:hypothetical protein
MPKLEIIDRKDKKIRSGVLLDPGGVLMVDKYIANILFINCVSN